MQPLLAQTVKELKSFWYSPIAYVVGAVFLLFQGYVFWLLILVLNDPRVDPSMTMAQFFFGGTFFYWLSVWFTAPLLTMRTFSEEKRTGTIELLLTAPITNAQVVLAKFLGAWLAYVSLWALTIPFFLYLRTLSAFDWGPVIAGYLGTWLFGGVLVAVGVFASSLTRNQVIAAVVSIVLLLLLWSIGILQVFIQDPESRTLIRYLSFMDHLQDFSKGIIDTRPMVFYASLAAIGLLLTTRVIGTPRWRS